MPTLKKDWAAGENPLAADMNDNFDQIEGAFKFGGDGSDGDLTVTGTTTLNDAPTDGVKIYQYNNLSIGASGVLTVGANLINAIVIIKVKGNLTVTDGGKIDLKGKGGIGGIGHNKNAYGAGGGGTEGAGVAFDSLTHGGGGGGGENGNASGGGGGGCAAAGTAGTQKGGAAVGAAGAAIQKQMHYMAQAFRMAVIACGSGGGGGGYGATAGTSDPGGGNGGAGGGGIILEVAGNISVGASAWIDISADNGQNAPGGQYGAGGGGGAAGMALVLYNGTLSGAGTVTATAGSGGSGGGANGGAGGAGSAGLFRIIKNIIFT